MDSQEGSLANYRLSKSKADLNAAQVLLKNKLYSQSINRSYYSIFHAVRALLAFDKFDSKKHSIAALPVGARCNLRGHKHKVSGSLISLCYLSDFEGYLRLCGQTCSRETSSRKGTLNARAAAGLLEINLKFN